MSLERGPGAGFILALLAVTAAVTWSAATQTELPVIEPVRLSSTPVAPDGPPRQGAVNLNEVRPDGRASLQETAYPLELFDSYGADRLEGEQRSFGWAVLNGTIAACEPCWEAGRSMADCMLELPERCEVMPILVERAMRLTLAGQTPPEVREEVAFADAWVPLPRELDAEALLGVDVGLLVAVDYASPFSADGEAVWSALQERFGDRLGVAWLMAPRDRVGARGAAAAALGAMSQGCFPEVHAALFAAQGPAWTGDAYPADELAKIYADAGCEGAPPSAPSAAPPELAQHLAMAEELGVRGTPTVFINGHRMRGLRDLEVYARFIELELEQQ